MTLLDIARDIVMISKNKLINIIKKIKKII